VFNRVGSIEYPADAGTAEEIVDAAIEAGAQDCESSEDGHTIYCDVEDLGDVAKALEQQFGEARSAQIIWKPHNTIEVDEETGGKVMRLLEALEDHDDVQHVYANFEVSDEVMEKLSA